MTPRARLALRALVAGLAGAATALSASPVEWTWVGWLCFPPLLRALDGLDARRSALVGWVWSLGCNVALFTWLGVATARFGELPGPVAAAAFVAYAALASLQGALLGLLDARIRAGRPGLRRLVFPALFAGIEQVWPQLFHWTAGSAQVQALVTQTADLGGPVLISWVVVTGGAGLDAGLELLLRRRRAAAVHEAGRAPVAEALLGLVVVAAAHGWGAWRRATVIDEADPRVRVAIVQPGAATTRDRPVPPERLQQALDALADELARRGERADLAVLPESAAPWPLLEVEPPVPGEPPSQVRRTLVAEAERALDAVARFARRAGCPTLVGGSLRTVRPGATVGGSPITARRNVLLLLDGQGRVVDRYDKHLLLPVAERLPGEETLPWLRRLVPFAGRYTPGPGPRVLLIGGPGGHASVERPTEVQDRGAAGPPKGARARVAPLICYEAVPTWPARDAVAGGADLLVNATNDVWFEGQGPALHAMIVRLRAIETRRTLVRVTTTGLTFAALPDGRRVALAPPGEPSVQVVELPLGRAGSPYVVVGDLLPWLLVAASLAALVAARRTSPAA